MSAPRQTVVPIRPRVSVVMPVFNVERFVGEAIASVLAQSFAEYELILVDDGSTDGSAAILEEVTDARVRIVRQANRGLAGARNTGIAHARGEFVALLDSDDRWHPDKLALHVIHLDNQPEIGVSYSGSRFIDEGGAPMRLFQRPRLEKIDGATIFCRNPVGNGSAPVLRRSALDKARFAHPLEPGRPCWFDESLRQSEDIELWLRLAVAHDVKFAGIAPPLTDYRLQRGGLSASVVKQYESWLAVVDRVRAYAPEFVARHEGRARAYQLRYLARRAVQLGDSSLALGLIGEGAKSSLAPFVEEPVKSVATLVAALAERRLGAERFAQMAERLSGGRLVA